MVTPELAMQPHSQAISTFKLPKNEASYIIIAITVTSVYQVSEH